MRIKDKEEIVWNTVDVTELFSRIRTSVKRWPWRG